jgi:hypothetical protein
MLHRVFKHLAGMTILSLATLGLLCSPAQARTLFIDFNNAESEINVFRQSQQGVASEVVVVPSYKRITHKQRLHIVKVNEAIEKFTVLVGDCAVAANIGAKKDKKCDGYYDQIVQLEKEREKTTGYYTANDLRDELLALLSDTKSVPFNMVVISGHHEQGFYRGDG